MIITTYILSALLGFYILSCIALYVFQERIIFFPVTLPSDYIFRFNAAFEEFFIEVDKEVKLNALLFSAPNSKGCVMYHHGNARCLVDWASNFPDFINNGYDVLFYDYRGYGKSGGGNTSEKQLISDAEKVFQFLQARYLNKEIIQFGRSLGSGIATAIAVKYPTQKLVLETPYYSILKLGKSMMPYLPIYSILKYKMRTWKRISKVSCPIFIIHGTHDELIPYADAQQLAECNDNVEFVTIHQGSHNNLPLFEEYKEVLQKKVFQSE